MPALLAEAFGVSRSDARRQLGQGGVKVDGEALADVDVAPERLDGRVLQLGKRRFARVRVTA
jgi:tyrosyl-tRNA synthetase